MSDAPAGLLLLDKPPGPTSHDAVAAVRRAAGTRRVGHFGTLDPFASGLLVCALGPATRLAPFCADHDKTYRAEIRLGVRSTTDDPEGELSEVAVEAPPTAAEVEAACRAWTGTVAQVPPAYSAKHVDGRRAYARARAGETVVLDPVAVTIDRIDILAYDWPDLHLLVRCGPGTYIRALARDLGETLGTGGTCTALRRTRSGPFRIEDALPWEALGEGERVRAALRPAVEAVASLPAARLEPEAQAAAVAGRGVPAPADLPPGAGWVRLEGPDGLVGLAEARRAGDGTAWLQPRRILFPAGERAGRRP